MEGNNSSNVKKCQNCQARVYDVRNKSNAEIKEIYNSNHENICVLANVSQLSGYKKRGFSSNFKRLGIVTAFISGSFLQPSMCAQENKKSDTFILEQKNVESDVITIEGIVKVKGLIGWKKLDEYSINVFSNDVLVSEILVDKKGKFKLDLNKKILSEKMAISIHAQGYKSISIKDIETKNTMFRVFLDKYNPRLIVGRFY